MYLNTKYYSGYKPFFFVYLTRRPLPLRERFMQQPLYFAYLFSYLCLVFLVSKNMKHLFVLLDVGFIS